MFINTFWFEIKINSEKKKHLKYRRIEKSTSKKNKIEFIVKCLSCCTIVIPLLEMSEIINHI